MEPRIWVDPYIYWYYTNYIDDLFLCSPRPLQIMLTQMLWPVYADNDGCRQPGDVTGILEQEWGKAMDCGQS